MHDYVAFALVRQAVRSIAKGRALVAESWFFCLFVLWCCLILDHLVSSLFNSSHSFPHSFWFCVTRRPHTCENLARVRFVFRCLPRNVFLSSPAHKLRCIQTHIHMNIQREQFKDYREPWLCPSFFFPPGPDDDPLCPRIIASALPDPSSAKPMPSFVACKFLALYIC